ncbi:MAG: TRAP transporter small permease subunit [Rhizobium sp.]|nr:TRAP transporter small permease subunit [Rhizobium sp.]
MGGLLALSKGIDAVSKIVGLVGEYLVLLCALISAFNAMSRYLFNASSNGWLEIQWYLFAYVVLLGASYTLRNNGHVRVDLIYGNVSPTKRLIIDIFGLIVFLLPVTAYLTWACWPFFYSSFIDGEMSLNAGGLIRWPVKILLVLGFGLLFLQGISELIKRIGALSGHIQVDTTYEKPLQ